MTTKNSTKKYKSKTTRKEPGPIKKAFGWFKTSMKNQDEEDAEKKGEHSDNLKFVWGFILACFSLCVLLALISHFFTGAEDQKLLSHPELPATNWLGKFGFWIAYWLIENTFGITSVLIPVLLVATGIRIMGTVKIRLHKWFLNCMILMIWGSAFMAFLKLQFEMMQKGYINWGGMIGDNEISLLIEKVGSLGAIITLGVTALLYIFYLSDEVITTIRNIVNRNAKKNLSETDEVEEGDEEENTEDEDTRIPLTTGEEVAQKTEKTIPFEDEPSRTATTIDFGNTQGEMEIPLKIGEQALPLEFANSTDDMKVVVGEEPEKADISSEGTLEPYDPKLDLEHYKYPTLDLLKHYDNIQSNIDMEEQQANKNKIIKVLSYFGVEISSIKATIGPTITLYEITPAPGIRISKIRGLEDDIALSLSALGIRIIAPIPGKGTIGIEVPNAKPQMVSMESVINSRKFQETDFELPMALGKTITNEVFMVDLTKMPHLLVAGATGQGKSVGLNAIITSLLYKKHPAELKFVMVDPKKVEFSVYNPIVNHFLAQVEGNEGMEEPIITDVNKVIQTLKSLCVEMDTRYDLLKKARARNVKEYNQKFKDRQLNPENGHKFMPYIVVIIDEFGDLIMTAGKEIELPIARIAQLARAVGIHMIIATQRPTTNIITGTIKANFPARLAFKVASSIDSKTILDRTGANQLIGKGDMLFLSGNDPVRVQCAFVDTPEVEDITSYIACQQSYNAPFPLPEVALEGGEEGEGPDVDLNHLDPMFNEVARMVVLEQSGSTSMIQRKFSIGYNRAGRLMDQLEKVGIVGPAKGSKPREVLCVSEEDLQFRLDNLG
ncbi:MAG: DNA translocase FtsK 4TM domain-containing protein [Bacteroidaceae bacterium]|nr:DNA translocase FtsK 4TM domain-containing protein [Bacteroidaceae bacterium]